MRQGLPPLSPQKWKTWLSGLYSVTYIYGVNPRLRVFENRVLRAVFERKRAR
jgi:hypothetical protein